VKRDAETYAGALLGLAILLSILLVLVALFI